MASPDEQVFSLAWKDFHSNISVGFHDLLTNGELVDVTLAADGRLIQAHKLVLSVCSSYFREMFKMNTTQYPIVFLKDVNYTALSYLLEFMYQGEVNVKEEDLTLFLSTAEQLQVRSLSKKKQEGISIPSNSGHGSQVGQCVTVEIEPVSKAFSDSVAVKRINKSSTKLNKTLFLHSVPAKRKCIDPLEASSSKSRKDDSPTVSVQEESFTVAPKPEPEFVNESMWDEDNKFIDAKNYDMDLGDDDSNMDLTDRMSSSEEDTTPNILTKEEANDLMKSLPPKSKTKYLQEYETFMKWRNLKKETSLSEDVFLSYFEELSKKIKPRSIWPIYSMVKRTVKLKHDIDLKDYTVLLKFLKKISVGMTVKRSKMFTSEDVEKYLNEAPNKKYLVTKVALIFGISGACNLKELCNLTLDDIETHENCMIIKVTNPDSEREFVVREPYTDIVKKYLALRPDDVNTNRIFLNYQRGKCFRQVIGKNKLATMPKQIATYLGLPNPELYTGHSYRRTSATLLAKSGANLSTLKLHCGWKSDRTAGRFMQNN